MASPDEDEATAGVGAGADEDDAMLWRVQTQEQRVGSSSRRWFGESETESTSTPIPADIEKEIPSDERTHLPQQPTATVLRAMPASHSLFLAASNWLPSSPSAASLPTSSKLRLYGLFKVLTSPPDAQPGPQTARPGFWSVEGRSKWDAWDAAAKEVAAKDDGEQGKAEARAEYVEIARSVGFDSQSLPFYFYGAYKRAGR